MYNILSQGGWHVGQSVLWDWLGGFDAVLCVTGGIEAEHDFFLKEDGIFDLLSMEDKNEKIVLIERMMKRVPIDVAKKCGNLLLHRDYRKPWAHLLLYRYLHKARYALLHDKPFDEMAHWRRWLRAFSYIGSKKKSVSFLVHQNPFEYVETFDQFDHDKVWPPFFDPYKIIFVYRDPYDQYLEIVKKGCNIITGVHRSYTGTYHLDALDRYYRMCRDAYLGRLRMARDYSPDQLLIFSFENFLKNHQSITSRIKTFIGIRSEWKPKHSKFVLEQSLKNIGNGKKDPDALAMLEVRPHIMQDICQLHDQLDALPHTIH